MPYPLEKHDFSSDCQTNFKLSDDSNRCILYLFIMTFECLGHNLLLLFLNGFYREGDIPHGHYFAMAIHFAACMAFNYGYMRIRGDKKQLSTIMGFEVITATIVGVISILMYSGTLVYDPGFVNYVVGKFQ